MNKELVDRLLEKTPSRQRQPHSKDERDALVKHIIEKIRGRIFGAKNDNLIFSFKLWITTARDNEQLNGKHFQMEGDRIFLNIILKKISDFSFDKEEKDYVFGMVLAWIDQKININGELPPKT